MFNHSTVHLSPRCYRQHIVHMYQLIQFRNCVKRVSTERYRLCAWHIGDPSSPAITDDNLDSATDNRSYVIVGRRFPLFPTNDDTRRLLYCSLSHESS